ncbi:MAG: hypothetical protein NTU49_02725, partial [Gammaproteobacteria bacterium]|nr:hypothetical protein [Gammaproteobacteria bacterium]
MRRSSSFLLKNLISTALVKVAAPLMIPPGLSQQDVKKTVSYFSSFGNNAFFKPNTDFAIITTEPAEQLWDDFHPDKSDHLPWRFSLGKDANGQEMFALIENVLMRCRKIERDGKVFFNNGKGEEETEEKFIIRRNKTDDDTWDVLKSDPRYVVVFRAEDYNTKKQRDKSAARFKSKKVPGWENPVFITEE